MAITQDECEVLGIVASMNADESLLEAIATIAHERAKNIRLRREGEWLRERIAQEDERLAHA